MNVKVLIGHKRFRLLLVILLIWAAAAEQGGGYEPLHSWVSQTGVEGTRKLVEAAQGLLQQLWQRDRG
jgi:hypothetical protein